jgi:hypothetical protein
VRHLEIRSLFGNDDKPKGAEDLVAGTLIAAVRRNQLHTLRYVGRSIHGGTIMLLMT